jgi:DNA-binding transcriptional MocR family regulator
MIVHLAASTTDRSAHGIAQAIGSLVADGTMRVGDRLPTVREVARAMSVSPTTVSEAWQTLQRHGIIETQRRRGTFVSERSGAMASRFWQVPVDRGLYDIDLSAGTPDPDLLPDPSAFFSAMGRAPQMTSYLDRPLLVALEDHLRADWPFDPEHITMVNGALDALDRVIEIAIPFASKVIVSDPGFPPILDMLDLVGATAIGVPLDSEGLIPEALADALQANDVAAIIVQPRAQNPTGASWSSTRVAALADILEPTSLLILEDDHSGPASGIDLYSLGTYLPGRVTHIRSFSKSHGPDFRLAAIGGPSNPVMDLIRRRRLGPSWTSRLLQQLLLDMLQSPKVEAEVDHAAHMYRQRWTAMRDSLSLRGVTVNPGNGLNMWVPVGDETVATVSLAANGIGVAPGRPFRVAAGGAPHLRITTSVIASNAETIADRIADAALLDPRA